jgi:predicted O-methyltransferase YrrM
VTQALWDAVDDYFRPLLIGPEPVLDAALEAAAEAGLPPHDVTAAEGKLLHLLARAIDARAILEIGTLAGYSTIWLARALPEGGRLITIEVDPTAAGVARRNLERASVRGVELLEGDAREVLATLTGPFDLVFIDADKRSNPAYLDHALRLSRPGTVIVADNVVRGGAVIDADTTDPSARGVREFARKLAQEPRVTATAIQTVGAKGHDGFVVALVTAD